MSSLGTNDKRVLEKLFQMGGGYVLNFSDRTFGEFFRDDVSVDIYDEQYNYASGSKANRLRGFWQVADDPLVAESIEKLIAFIETQILLETLKRQDFPSELTRRGHQIAARLQGTIGSEMQVTLPVAREQDFYLYTCASRSSPISSSNVFFRVTGVELAETLRRLFSKEYSFGADDRSFFLKCADEVEPEDRILFEEAIDELDLYDDPDPYIYDPPPSGETMLRAQFARRAQAWEVRVVPPRIHKENASEGSDGRDARPQSNTGAAQSAPIPGAGQIGTVNHGDQYIYHGPIGAIGREAVGTVNTFQQCWQRIEPEVDLEKLATELALLRSELAKSAVTREAIVELGRLAEAEGEAQSSNGAGVMKALSRIGKAVWETAERIGTDLAAKVIVEASKP
jgi:hypothetical protein